MDHVTLTYTTPVV